MANSPIKLVVALTILAATSALVRSEEANTSQQQQLNVSSINVTSPTNSGLHLGQDCILLNIRFAHTEVIPKEMQPSVPDCDKHCKCYSGKILCQPICPPLPNDPPIDMPCEPGYAIQTQDECCMKWACPPTEDYALKNLSLTPLNATTVEVTFVLPLFAVGREGKAELNYTGLPLSDPASQNELPPANAIWLRRQNIRTANGIFPRQSIKYFMQQLKPNYRYWFKLGVIFAEQSPPFDSMLESNLETVTTYPLSPTITLPLSTTPITSTTTTTTSTPAPSLQTLAPATTSTTNPTTSTSTTTSTTTTTTTTTPLPPQTIAPPTTQAPTTTTSTTTAATTVASRMMQTLAPVMSTTTSSSTTMSPPIAVQNLLADIMKQGPSEMTYEINKQQKLPPCSLLNNNINNEIDQQASLGISLPWAQQVNIPLQNYASGLLLALVFVSLLLVITTFKLFRTSSYGHMAPQAYDNPSFTKLVSFYAQQPNEMLVDENNQNYSNNVILAERKNFEADKLSPLHRS